MIEFDWFIEARDKDPSSLPLHRDATRSIPESEPSSDSPGGRPGRFDAAFGVVAKAVFRACVDGFAAFGAAHHGTLVPERWTHHVPAPGQEKPAGKDSETRAPLETRGGTVVPFPKALSEARQPAAAAPLPPAPLRWRARLWSAAASVHGSLRRQSSNRRLSLDWEALDDRTLKDLGLYRISSGRVIRIRDYGE